MPPRYVYWTILAGGLPTAFRAAEKDELLPTFNRLKEKQPDAEMKYFARGKLWNSPEEALRAEDRDERGGGERRGRDWRPGGEHRDPRQPFKDAKKARNQDQRQRRWEHKQEDTGGRRDERGRDRGTEPSGSRAASEPRTPPPRERPHGDPMRREVASGFKRRDSGEGYRGKREWQDRPFDKPQGRPFDRAQGRPFDKAQGRPPKKEWRDRPPGGREARGDRQWRDRPVDKPQGRSFDRPQGRPFDPAQGRPPKKEWRDRPPGSGHRRPPRQDWRDRQPPPNVPSGFSKNNDRRPEARGGQRDTRGSRPWSDRPPKKEWRDRPFDKAQGRPLDKAQGKPFDKGKGRPPRNKPHGDKLAGRPFRPKAEGRPWNREERGQEPPPPPRPTGPNREPRPGQEPRPEPPPRPSEPVINPPTPERGRESNKGGKLRRKRES